MPLAAPAEGAGRLSLDSEWAENPLLNSGESYRGDAAMGSNGVSFTPFLNFPTLSGNGLLRNEGNDHT